MIAIPILMIRHTDTCLIRALARKRQLDQAPESSRGLDVATFGEEQLFDLAPPRREEIAVSTGSSTSC